MKKREREREREREEERERQTDRQTDRQTEDGINISNCKIIKLIERVADH